ncbi:MAG: IS3 family transposase [Betaproteobacteria bacterium]
MERCRGGFPVVLMSRVLSVSRAGFYAWRKREPSAQAERRKAVGEALEKTYYRCRRRYGAPRLTAQLSAQGMGCSRNYVAKLLRERKLKVLNGKGFRYERAVESMTQVKQNMLARDFASDGPNRKWVSDITYIRVGRGWAYLAVVLDLFSRTLVGWALDTHVRETLILEALTMAAARRNLAQGLLLHSDRGVQYRGNEYQQRLEDLGIVASMSRKGNCWDNAVMEAFFARLKVELIYPENYRTLEELRTGLFEHIEIFHNRQRRHSALGYDNPAHYELLFNQMNVSTIRG